MKVIYLTRGKQHLVLLPDVPKWFVVDSFATSLLKRMLTRGTSVEDLVARAPKERREEVRKTCVDLASLVGEHIEPPKEITATLTSKTTVAMISVTRNCNLRCPHCYVDARGSSGNELRLEEHGGLASAVRNELATDPSVRYGVNLTGGEPFIHGEILRIVSAYRAVGLEVGISTNGLLIDSNHISALREQGVVVSVSLDGCSPKTHDAIRGHGTFDRVVNRIRALVVGNVKVGINFLLHAGNFNELETTIGLAHNLGCSGFNPIDLVQLGRACNSRLARVSEATAFRRIAHHLVRHPEQQHLFAKTSMFSSLGAALLAGITCASCGVGNRPCVYVDSEGYVYACANTQRPEFCLGNIRKNRLAECLRPEHPVLTRFRGLNVETLNPRCSKCNVRKFCGGDCRGETYNVTSNLNAPYVACADRKRSLLELMWIVARHPEIFAERADEYLENADRQA